MGEALCVLSGFGLGIGAECLQDEPPALQDRGIGTTLKCGVELVGERGEYRTRFWASEPGVRTVVASSGLLGAQLQRFGFVVIAGKCAQHVGIGDERASGRRRARCG
jgi:hypothetical protein